MSTESSQDSLNSVDLESMSDEELTAFVTRVRAMRTTNQLALDLKPKGRVVKKDKQPSLLAMLMALPDDEEEEK